MIASESWRRELPADPLPALLASRDTALLYHVRRDLLDEKQSAGSLWKHPSAQRILKKQQGDGSWQAERGQEHSVGKVYATSLAVLSLSVKYHYLPIYQR